MPTFDSDFVPYGNSGDAVLLWLESVDHPSSYCEDRLRTPVSESKPSSPQQRCSRPGSSCSREMWPSREVSPRKRSRRDDNDTNDPVDDRYTNPAPGDAAQITPRLLRQLSFQPGTFHLLELLKDPFVTAPSAAPFTNQPNLVHSASLQLRKAQPEAVQPEGSRSSNTRGTSNSWWSKSPTKNPIQRVADLRFFDKPVVYKPNDKRCLPPEVEAIAQVVDDINLLNTGIFPLEIKVHLSESFRKSPVSRSIC